MMDFGSTEARAKEVAPPATREGGHMEAAAAKPLSASPLLTADGVDKMYHQLVEIHAITAAQLAECTRWHRFDPASSPIQAGASRQRPIAMPYAAMVAGPMCQATGRLPGSPGGMGTQPEHSDFFRNTFEASHGIAIEHATSYEAVVPRPT
jgi:hypothetical protein